MIFRGRLPVLLILVICLILVLAIGCSGGAEDDVPASGEEDGGVGSPDHDASGEEIPLPGNIAGNIQNGGLVAMQDGQIYFGYRNAAGGGLYRAAPDGSGPVMLVPEEARFINVEGDWIYYVVMEEPVYDEVWDDYFEQPGSVVKVRTDGSDRQVLAEGPASYLQLAGGWLYFVQMDPHAGGSLFKVRPDGSGLTRVIEQPCGSFTVAGESIFYTGIDEGWKLYRAGLDGSGGTLIYNDSAAFLIVLGEQLFFAGDIIPAGAYLGGESLYTVGVSGGAVTGVGEIMPAYLNRGDDGRLYYTGSHLEGVISQALYTVRPDGTGNTLLNNEACSNIHLFGDWIYYINLADNNRLYRINTDGSGRQGIY